MAPFPIKTCTNYYIKFSLDCARAVFLFFCAKIKEKGEIMSNKVRASHILVETEQEAKDLMAQINSAEDFARLAAENSLCPSGANGGDLGFFGRGMMVKPFEDAAFALETGKVSEPVQTQFGWHLILVTEKA